MAAKTESKDQMQEIKQWFSDASHKLNNQMNNLGSQAKKYSAKGVEVTSDTIADHPLKAVGIAVACGFLVGYLIGKK